MKGCLEEALGRAANLAALLEVARVANLYGVEPRSRVDLVHRALEAGIVRAKSPNHVFRLVEAANLYLPAGPERDAILAGALLKPLEPPYDPNDPERAPLLPLRP